MDLSEERVTDDEAKEVATRLSQNSVDLTEPTVSSLAAVLGVDVAKVSRELEILRHERRLEELHRERQEEEQPIVEDAGSNREAFLKRQEMMYAWQHRGEEPMEDEKRITRRPRLNPTVTLVIGAIVLFAMYQIMSFSCAR